MANYGQHSGDSTGFDASLRPTAASEITFHIKTERTVFISQCVDEREDGNIVHDGIEKESGSHVVVHEWIVPYPGFKKERTAAELEIIAKYNGIAQAVENELHSLMKLSHKNLVMFLAMRYVIDDDQLQVDILQEYVTGTCLETKINSNTPMTLGEVRNVLEQLLVALDYLHSNSVVHKQLEASSVTLDSHGTLRLADFSIKKRLADLYKESHIEQPGVTFVNDTRPFINSKNGDILNLGMLALSLVQGACIKNYRPDIPSQLPPAFKDFLLKCLSVDERMHLTASELLEHNFLKEAVVKGPEMLSVHENGTVVMEEPTGNESETDQTTLSQPPQMLSRIQSDFEEIKPLGKGAFGSVLQARNIVDGQRYAIKKIPLDPEKLLFNKEMTKEAKLLSSLNHENVVRYYNSWIETLNPDDMSTEASSSVQPLSLSSGIDGDITDNASSVPCFDTNSDSAFIYFEVSGAGQVLDDGNTIPSDSPQEDEDIGVFEDVVPDKDASDDSVSGASRAIGLAKITTTDEASLENVPKECLYIQMEFCERGTLREAIDEGLDNRRIWYFFGEILHGLAYIHKQSMIHRDLKPQNIFLDRNHRIKIGDFGLATSRTGGVTNSSAMENLAISKSEGTDSGMTGRVGTALYAAPELNIASRVSYDQKVDIYSLGIIFFEMCIGGFQTGMERVRVLGNLRLEEIKFPEDFNKAERYTESQIIKWCLMHSPDQRPTADELLESPLAPAPDFEKSNLVLKYILQILKDPHSARHSNLMHENLSQHNRCYDDEFYDIDLHKNQFVMSLHLMQEEIHATLISIMKRHGAVKVNLPLLLPRQHVADEYVDVVNRRNFAEFETPGVASFMDACGMIVTLLYDLRVSFARYVRQNGITDLKMYAIEKVYRRAEGHRSHPRELLECAFDIVTPTVGNLIPEAEGISVVSEIISAIPALTERSYKITLNHTVLLLAILEHCGIPMDKHDEVKRILDDAKSKKLTKSELEARLLDLSCTSQHMSMPTLFNFIHQQVPLDKIQAQLKELMENEHSQVPMRASQALHELEALRINLTSCGINMPVVVHLGFVHNLRLYSGIIFQVSDETIKEKEMLKVIAAGGRYDKLIKDLAVPTLDPSVYPRRQHAFGVSIAVDKIVAHALTHPPNTCRLLSNIDVLVVAVGRNQLSNERIQILRQLWAAGIRAETTPEDTETETDSLEMLQEMAAKCCIAHLVILKDNSSIIKVRSHDATMGFNKHNEKSMPMKELVEYLTHKIKDNDELSSPLA